MTRTITPAEAAIAADIAKTSDRPGSNTALGIPTRIGDFLHYRDGSKRLDPIPANLPQTFTWSDK